MQKSKNKNPIPLRIISFYSCIILSILATAKNGPCLLIRKEPFTLYKKILKQNSISLFLPVYL